MINFLLDTNVFLWYFWGSDRIETIKKLIQSEDSDVYISAVSWWEIAIKIRTGKLSLDPQQLVFFSNKYCFKELPIDSQYIKAYLELKHIHKDPFDCMLLSQAITHPMRIITGDSILAKYSSLVMVI